MIYEIINKAAECGINLYSIAFRSRSVRRGADQTRYERSGGENERSYKVYI